MNKVDVRNASSTASCPTNDESSTVIRAGFITAGLVTLLLAALTACGTTPEDPDEYTPPEPGYPALREAPPCDLERTSFVIDGMVVENLDEIRREPPSIDHDRYERSDAALSWVIDAYGQLFDVRPDMDAAVAEMIRDGSMRWLLHLETCVDGDDDYARVIAEDAAGRESLIAAVGRVNEDGSIDVHDGTALVPAPAFFRTSPGGFLWVPGSGFSVTFTEEADGSISGTIGVGLSAHRDDLLPIWDVIAESLTPLVDDVGTEPGDFAAEFDLNTDGTITSTELGDNDLIQSLFTPDVDLYDRYGTDEQVYWPLHDQVEDHLSLAIGFTATPL
jgi:hypothetical protein